jgi:hypothetical protein
MNEPLVFTPKIASAESAQSDTATADALKYRRRLSDKILVAFYHACDDRDVLTAEQLLKTLESVLSRRVFDQGPERRRGAEILIDANFRILDLKQSGR